MISLRSAGRQAVEASTCATCAVGLIKFPVYLLLCVAVEKQETPSTEKIQQREQAVEAAIIH